MHQAMRFYESYASPYLTNTVLCRLQKTKRDFPPGRLCPASPDRRSRVLGGPLSGPLSYDFTELILSLRSSSDLM
jgi:hypothetical protein